MGVRMETWASSPDIELFGVAPCDLLTLIAARTIGSGRIFAAWLAARRAAAFEPMLALSSE